MVSATTNAQGRRFSSACGFKAISAGRTISDILRWVGVELLSLWRVSFSGAFLRSLGLLAFVVVLCSTPEAELPAA